MLDSKLLDDLAQRLANAVPTGLQQARDDVEKNFKAVLQGSFDKMNLVSREEFEAQRAVLMRTREKLETLEKQVSQLEEKILKH